MKKALEVFAVVCVVLAVILFFAPILIGGAIDEPWQFMLFPFLSGHGIEKVIFVIFGIVNLLLALLVLFIVKKINW
ncbi:hypothetical protein [Aquisalibacillus elongatus]|uniref:YfzA-like protein n=1 Tax=Aquisalibacillus elongatus TaxID=485577 RepID=A0A3N5C385_9BACI|nr:hypothetical protein [Aquisalibacillus elongatus]RPF53882.1 hypothetical protein EDC24_1065 [Aquisalibacillus elongatus]